MEKNILNLSEAAEFTGLSKSSMYKLTHYRKIEHYKPNGKNIYFKKEDLESFLLKGKKEVIITIDVDKLAADYCLNRK